MRFQYLMTAMTGVIAMAASGCTPGSLLEAIKKQEKNGVISPGQYVLVPFSDQMVLGYLPSRPLTPKDEKDRILEPGPAPCFFVTPTVGRGLGNLTVEYTSDQKLRAEVDATVAKFKLGLGNNRKATLDLVDLTVLRGIGVLNVTACPIGESGDYKVFTTLVRAASLKLAFDNKLSLQPGVQVPIPQSGGIVNVGVEGNSSTSEKTTLDGTNIVIAGTLSDVHVDIAEKKYDLGTEPAAAVYDFPEGYGGKVTVRSYKASEDQLTINVQTDTNLEGTAPAGIVTCPLAQDKSLRMGENCIVFVPPGSVQVLVDWRKDPTNKKIELRIKAYRTKFAPDMTTTPVKGG